MAKNRGLPVNGLIVLNKPKGISSHKAVSTIKRILNAAKAGHFGTLDPMAEGVLLVALGKATKFFDYYLHKPKLYSGEIKFGYSTDTYDAEGERNSDIKEVSLEDKKIKGILKKFTGSIEQMPPVYSAKKLKGKPLYKYARANQEVDLKPCTITVFSINGEIKDKDTLSFKTLVSSGTYIRSLAHDIGTEYKTGAHLISLKRESIGEFTISDAVTFESLEKLSGETFESLINSGYIKPMEAMLNHFPRLTVNDNSVKNVLNGMQLTEKDIFSITEGEGDNYRVFDRKGKFLSLSRACTESKSFKPLIVFN